MTAIYTEHQQWKDEATGELMVGGQVYIGNQNLDPEVSAKNIYSDRSLSTAIANPQTIGSDGRTENKIWVSEKYSIKVKDINGVVKFTDLDRGQDDNIGNTRLINSLGINDVVVTGSPTVTSLTDNQTYIFDAPADNTGAMTLKIDTLPAYSIRKGHDQLMASGDVKASQRIVVVWNADDSWFEIQSNVLGSVFSGNVQVGGDILDANGNEIISLNETASAVNHLDSQNATTGNGPTLNAAGDDANIDLNLSGKGAGTVKAGGVEINPAVVSGHIRAGNTQIVDGGTGTIAFDVSSNVTQSTYETLGPTGSGATNIWSQLDVLPSNATILLADARMSLSSASGVPATLQFFATDGDSTEATASATKNLIAGLTLDFDAAITGNSYTWTRIMIPLNSSQVFRATWAAANTDSSDVFLYYRGFMTD